MSRGAAVVLAALLAVSMPSRAAGPAPAPSVAEASTADHANAPGPATFRIRTVGPDWADHLPRDADAATQAYLDRLPQDVVRRSNAYFEGGYWLQLWNFLLGLGIAALLLAGQRSARLRDWALRVGRKPVGRDALFGAVYAAWGGLLSFPLSFYQGYLREHAYSMSTQGLGAWLGEQAIGLGVAMVAVGAVAAVLYAVLRRVGANWWVWGTLVSIAFLVLTMLVAPVVVDPLFNTYKPIADGPVRTAVLALARANGVPTNDIVEFDASRQTTRVSANVAGIFGSASVRLNDNLLRRTSLAEIRSVVGHELGHYVLNHLYKMVAEMTIVLSIGFLFTQWALKRLFARHGSRLGLRGVGDVASMPLLVAVLSTYLFVATPVVNTLIRTQEIEADRFGLNLAREPHGEAEVDLKLTEYRKPDPTPLEEFVFFDHPSTRFRIHDAMRWREAMGTP